MEWQNQFLNWLFVWESILLVAKGYLELVYVEDRNKLSTTLLKKLTGENLMLPVLNYIINSYV
jgi:hypothetical protein